MYIQTRTRTLLRTGRVSYSQLPLLFAHHRTPLVSVCVCACVPVCVRARRHYVQVQRVCFQRHARRCMSTCVYVYVCTCVCVHCLTRTCSDMYASAKRIHDFLSRRLHLHTSAPLLLALLRLTTWSFYVINVHAVLRTLMQQQQQQLQSILQLCRDARSSTGRRR